MHIPFVCPSCSHKMKVPESFAGKKVKCLQCTAVALVPVPEPAPAGAAATEPAPPANIAFTCPSCGSTFDVAADLAGKTIRCRECEEWERVPLPAGQEEAEDAHEEVVRAVAAPEGSASHTPLPAGQEKVFYRRHGVLVTNLRVALAGHDYSLPTVSAARKAWRDVLEYRFRPALAALCVLCVAAVAVFLVGTLSAGTGGRPVLPWLAGVLLSIPPAVVCGLLGGGWVRRRIHRLVLVSSGVEVQVLETENAVLVSDVFDAISQAIAARG
jgi:hypothetical protein